MALQSCKKNNEERIVGDWVRYCDSPFINCSSSVISNYKDDGTSFLYKNNDCERDSIISGPHYYEIKNDTLIRTPGTTYSVDTFLIEELTRRKLILTRFINGQLSSPNKFKKCR